MARSGYDFALVLGGGGARGLAHMGVLKILEAEKIKPDLIVGTSMGAVIGGMYAQLGDITEVERKVKSFIDTFGVKGKWLSFLGEPDVKDQKDLFHDIANYVKKQYIGIRTLTSVSLEDRNVLLDPLRSFFIEDKVENCVIPFAAVSIDLRHGRTRVFRSGPIIEAVYASAAVEGVFPPLDYNGMLLSDAGPVAIVPVEIARQMGARKVIAVDVSLAIKEEHECSTGLQVILRADTIAQDRIRAMDTARADLVISPRIKAVHWANFSRVDYCVRRGEISTKKALGEIRKLLSRPLWKKVFFLGR